MGMFDTVTVINIADEAFRHNDVSYQTKSLECQLNEYIIFNGQLWQQYDGEKGERFALAQPVAFTGDLNIYTDYTSLDRVYWVEYSLTFQNGILASVETVSERLTRDNSDKSVYRPAPQSKGSCITIDFRGVDGAIYDAFHADLDGNLDRLREVLGDPTAEVIYQVRAEGRGLMAASGVTRWLHSVVQSLSDFTPAGPERVSPKDNSGDSLTVVLDEARYMLGGSGKV